MRFIFEEVTERLDQLVSDHKEAMSYGGATSFDKYAELVGRIHGLRLAIDEVRDVEIMLNKQEDDD